MEKEIIKLTDTQWRDLVQEEYLQIDDTEVEIKVVEVGYDGSGRHTEQHHLIFQRVSDGKYFRVNYETSVKDSMGWNECNYGNGKAVEVFPETITIITYK